VEICPETGQKRDKVSGTTDQNQPKTDVMTAGTRKSIKKLGDQNQHIVLQSDDGLSDQIAPFRAPCDPASGHTRNFPDLIATTRPVRAT
jgi:hypothetical protein